MDIKKIKDFVVENIYILALTGFSSVVFLVNLRMNIFRYNNFDMGKFDLGNMTQMVWYTMNGKFMYLTDYFGTNMPRWSMSHVDPILALWTPLFAIVPHPLTLVLTLIFMVIFSSLIIYKLGVLYFDSKLSGFLLGMAYLFYPALGFLTAWNGYHGVTAGIITFLAAVYVFEKMYKEDNFNTKGLILFWVFLVLTMMTKEQVPLYIFMYGIFIALFRGMKKLGLSMMVVGFLWFYVAFFVIIPAYAPIRAEGFQRFATEMQINTASLTDVSNDNFFLSRYEGFGDSYGEVIIGILTSPMQVIQVFFGGDKLENFNRTIAPTAYFALLYPAFFIVAAPDFLINYLTTAGGIGTSEIINHRISMIVPIMFLSVLFFVDYISKMFVLYFPKLKDKKLYLINGLLIIVLGANIYTTFYYNNPVYLWLTQAVRKRLPFASAVLAKEAPEVIQESELELGERFRLTALENKDRDCALKVIDTIPDDPKVSVTGPDYLGSHLAQRETYAIFPSLFNSADYVVVDVFAQKITRILDADVSLVRNVVADVIKDPNYEMVFGCGNLFIFENQGPHNKDPKLSLQEYFNYEEKTDLEIFQSLTVVDYSLPTQVNRGENYEGFITYTKRDNNSLSDYLLFLTFVHEETGKVYQTANLPSFALGQPSTWRENYYYKEDLRLLFPQYLEEGTYRSFIGMDNQIRTRSIYLGDVEVN